MDHPIETPLGEANNVLVVAPSDAESADDLCRSLLAHEEPGDRSVLAVTVAQSPEERLQVLELHAGSDSSSPTTVIAVGEGARSGADSAADEGVDVGRDADDPRITLRTVGDPSDTPSLGTEMTEWLTRWSAEGYSVVGCVHTLSDLLRTAGYGRTVELLVPLLERARRLDASVHYHLDPSAHDDDVVDLLGPLFDVVVEVHPDGSRTIRREESPQDPDAAPADRREETITTPTPANDVFFDLLSDHRRRAVLYALRTHDPGESVSVDTLVDRLLEAERRERTPDRTDLRDRIAVDLRHRHLPRLADAGLLDRDGDEVVRNAWEPPLRRWIDQAVRTDEASGAVESLSADDDSVTDDVDLLTDDDPATDDDDSVTDDGDPTTDDSDSATDDSDSVTDADDTTTEDDESVAGDDATTEDDESDSVP